MHLDTPYLLRIHLFGQLITSLMFHKANKGNISQVESADLAFVRIILRL